MRAVGEPLSESFRYRSHIAGIDGHHDREACRCSEASGRRIPFGIQNGLAIHRHATGDKKIAGFGRFRIEFLFPVFGDVLQGLKFTVLVIKRYYQSVVAGDT
ncbi:TPA: hypothetical protein MH648_24400 [Klebsiella pneumoniae]|nr:hypothetical protein [Klebsiella pneumoniae]